MKIRILGIELFQTDEQTDRKICRFLYSVQQTYSTAFKQKTAQTALSNHLSLYDVPPKRFDRYIAIFRDVSKGRVK